MSKLDKKKEMLTTLRSMIGFFIAIILTITAGLIGMYYKDRFDILFFIGAGLDIIFVMMLPILATILLKNLDEIEEL